MKVKCKASQGYPNLTVNKVYEVAELVPQLHTRNFTFPRYVSVIDDRGENFTSMGHAYRFETLEGESMEEYIKKKMVDTYDYR